MPTESKYRCYDEGAPTWNPDMNSVRLRVSRMQVDQAWGSRGARGGRGTPVGVGGHNVHEGRALTWKRLMQIVGPAIKVWQGIGVGTGCR